mmetsp:Transcript_1825/g.3857  ORF Transcript_1825/g.3857 Transcript_1825/m.3857 type:complete len:242 (+) Transcript_1825:112-837(+)
MQRRACQTCRIIHPARHRRHVIATAHARRDRHSAAGPLRFLAFCFLLLAVCHSASSKKASSPCARASTSPCAGSKEPFGREVAPTPSPPTSPVAPAPSAFSLLPSVAGIAPHIQQSSSRPPEALRCRLPRMCASTCSQLTCTRQYLQTRTFPCASIRRSSFALALLCMLAPPFESAASFARGGGWATTARRGDRTKDSRPRRPNSMNLTISTTAVTSRAAEKEVSIGCRNGATGSPISARK